MQSGGSGRLIYPSNAEDEREAAVSQLVEALAEAERAGMEWAAKTIENLTMTVVTAERRYRETHGKEELNGVRMSERVEFALTSHGLAIAQVIRTQAQGQGVL